MSDPSRMRKFAGPWLLMGGFAVAAAWPARAAYSDDWKRMEPITPQGYVCHRAENALKIDGHLNDPAWERASWTLEFQDIEGEARPKPRFRTRAKMVWDDDFFYLAADMEEPHVWATLTNHDAVIFHDNDFEVFIDPDGDSHDYYEFELNALNTGWDLMLKKSYKDGGPALNSWEIPGLKTAIHVRGTLNNPADVDQGWSVEIALPWKVLAEYARRPAPPEEGDQWRVNFSRVEWLVQIADGRYQKVTGRKEDNWVWSPQGIIDMHRPEKWGYIQFTRRQPGQVTFMADPAAAAARNLLQTIYYRQKDYRKNHNHWAGKLEDLNVASVPMSPALSAPELRITTNGFQASVTLSTERGSTQQWYIREDARVWRE